MTLPVGITTVTITTEAAALEARATGYTFTTTTHDN